MSVFQVFDRYGGEENSGKIRTRSKGEEQRDLVRLVTLTRNLTLNISSRLNIWT